MLYIVLFVIGEQGYSMHTAALCQKRFLEIGKDFEELNIKETDVSIYGVYSVSG